MTEHRPPTYLRGRVVTPTAVIDDGVVVVDGDTIAWVGPAGAAGRHGWPGAPGAAETPSTLLPGLVDVHNHGGGGAGFPDVSTPGEARVAIREHLAHGTTTLVASLVTATPDTLRQRVAVTKDATRVVVPCARCSRIATRASPGVLTSGKPAPPPPWLCTSTSPGSRVDGVSAAPGASGQPCRPAAPAGPTQAIVSPSTTTTPSSITAVGVTTRPRR